MEEALIRVKDLCKIYNPGENEVRALDHINLEINKGEFVAIIGQSGSGKSTFMNMLGCLDVPTSGEYFLNGTDVSTMEDNELSEVRNREIGFIFQGFNLISNLTAIENVELPLVYRGVDRKTRHKLAVESLTMVGLEKRMDHRPNEMSGGQQQRVAIARALASDPKILLCDEATSALDPQTTSSILELLKKINKQFGITIVIITHQMSVVREICTHVAIMYEGEVVEKGLVADIFANPQSEVAKELIRKDTGSDIDADSRLDAGREKGQAEIKSGEKIRIVFSENSAFEPVIANLILTFGEPVNTSRIASACSLSAETV